MQNFNLKSILVGAAVATSAIAIPVATNLRRADDTLWENSDGGNTKISIDDRRVDWGDISPSQVLGKIKDSCTSQGCSKGQEVKLDGAWKAKDGVQSGELTIHVNGVFDEESKEGNIDTLVDIAIEFFKEATDREAYDVDQTAAVSVYSGQLQSSDDVETYQMYEGPEIVQISVRDDDRDLNSWLHISVSTEMTEDLAGMCELVTGIAESLVGAVSGIGGSAIGLASLGCGALEKEE